MRNCVLFIVGFLTTINLICQNLPLFERVPSETTKVKFNNKIVETESENIFIYDNFYAGAGVGLGDFNNDGLLDIYFCGNLVKDKLYLNRGNFKFEDVTKQSGIEDLDSGWSSSVSIIDINKDGLLDIFVTKELYDDKPNLRRNKLYLNQGNSKFIDVAKHVGLGDTLRTRAAVFLDFDKDQDLDVFLLHQPPNPGIYSKYKSMSDDGSLLDDKFAPRLYENKNGMFTDISAKANILNPGFSNAACVADLNGDSYPDIVVANDFEAPDMIYMNQKDGTFENVANNAFNHTSYYSMGIDIADINNDNLLDVFTVDMSAEDNFRLKANMGGMNPDKFWKIVNKGWNYQYMFNAMQLNNGNSTFSEIAHLSGISSTDWSWSPLIADFDNDGFKDIFVTNGLLRDIRNTDADKNVKLFIHKKIQKYLKEKGNLDNIDVWDLVDHTELAEIYPSNKLQNKLFRNKNGYQFNDVSTELGITDKGFSHGSAYGDLDNDGDLDLIVNNMNEEAFIYRNNSTNNFLRINLVSRENSPVFGTKISIKYNNDSQFVEYTSARGMYSTSEQVAHFGLNDIDKVDQLKVIWPNQKESILENITTNQKLTFYLEDAEKVAQGNSNMNSGIFSDITATNIIDYKHVENTFDDFKIQVLLPHKMSQFGPALTIGDVNNDGLQDVFVGGSVGNVGKLFIQNKLGKFTIHDNADFNKDMAREDLDAVFFDIDKDGDQDLYVVSGGNEYAEGNINYKDRLYLNNGGGNFTKSSNVIDNSEISGSKVIPADFDDDGDLDLFVGGRLIPHQYPLSADSKLLENRNGKLVDVSKNRAPELKNLGMVTDAIWSDFDGDNDLDLIIVGEWMSITIFENSKGNFSKLSVPDLNDTSGWWFSIEQGDFDNDGDMDFIAGNLGLNYKYKTSKETPFDVYYKDFDQNGVKDIVLGYYNYGKHYPVRGFSCSSQQIPTLKKEIKKYDVFASMGIEDVYGQSNLDKALHYETQTFASVFIENKGNGRFELNDLPVEAQFSNINDIMIEDVNGDDNLDLLIIGNLFVSEIETTRNDAGKGLILLGDGMNNFKPLTNIESGFFARGDAKKVKRLKDKNNNLILIANNNNVLQVFQLHK